MKNKNPKKTASVKTIWVVIAAVAVLAAIVLLVVLTAGDGADDPTAPTGTAATNPIKIDSAEKVDINLGYGLYIRDVANYTGIYMEDGTDELVSGVLMIVVENTGDTDVQLADIEMPVGDQVAYFKLTTLPAGDSVVLLESNRMQYADVEYTTAITKNVVLFDTPIDLCQDKIKIQGLNGVLNVTNISGEDITGDVVIYYKNSASDMLYGGITYRVVISGGMRADEIKQITAGHFTTSGSRVMWVTVG